MPSVARRQPHTLHHWLWLLMGLLMALTTLFITRIVWLITQPTHSHTSIHSAVPYSQLSAAPKPHQNSPVYTHQKATITRKQPLFLVINEPSLPNHTDKKPSPEAPHPVIKQGTPATHVAPSLHLAAFFKPSQEETPKTIIPTYTPTATTQAAAPLQSIPHSSVPTVNLPPVKVVNTHPLPEPVKPVHAAAVPYPSGVMPLQVRVALANQHLQQGEYQPALLLINRGLQQFPHAHALIKLKALILVALQQPDAALALLCENAPTIEKDPDWYAFIAGLYQRQGNHAQAVDYYQRVLAERSDRGNWWVGLAISQEALGEKEAALQSYQHAQEAAISPALAAYVSDRIKVL